MKTSLIRLLGVAAIAATSFSAAACTSKKAVDVTIAEIKELDEEGNWALEGQYVKVENIGLAGRYGNTAYCQIGGGGSDIMGIEVQLKSWPNFKNSASGWAADVTVSGTVTDVDGRAVLKNATMKVNSEREYSADGSSHTGGFEALYYYIKVTRAQFDYSFDRTYTGVPHNTILEIASVPTLPEGDEVTEDIVFDVVFPGENIDVTDPKNYSLIPAVIPAGIGKVALDTIKAYFANHGVGDFVDISFESHFGTFNGYSQPAILIESFWGQDMKVPAAEDMPKVYTEFAGVQAAFNDTFADPIVDFGDDTRVSSYGPCVVEKVTDYKKNLNDSSWIVINKPKDAYVLTMNMNIIDPENNYLDCFNAVCDALEAAGFEETNKSQREKGEFIAVLTKEVVSEESTTTVNEKEVYVANMGTYLIVDYFAPKKAATV